MQVQLQAALKNPQEFDKKDKKEASGKQPAAPPTSIWDGNAVIPGKGPSISFPTLPLLKTQ